MIYTLYNEDYKSIIKIYTSNYYSIRLLITDFFQSGYVLTEEKDEKIPTTSASVIVESGCILYDISGNELQQKEIIRELKTKTNFPIIVLSENGSVDQAVEAIKEGAYDFILKNNASLRLQPSITNALEKSRFEFNDIKQRERKIRVYNSLTKREKEVISLVAQGLTNKAIGEKLGISMKTVQQHRGQHAKNYKLKLQ